MCVVIDDQLNVLPISSHMAAIKAVPPKTQVIGSTSVHQSVLALVCPSTLGL